MGIIFQNWTLESQIGYKTSGLANQCTHRYIWYSSCLLNKCLISKSNWSYKLFFVFFDIPRRYKIYIEGFGWSVSEKYILACDSTTLLVKPKFYDFFTRGLQPLHHYWPIRTDGKCKSIKFAVDWGNNHQQKVSLSDTNFYMENYILPGLFFFSSACIS